MGLDQYAYTRDTAPDQPTDFRLREGLSDTFPDENDEEAWTDEVCDRYYDAVREYDEKHEIFYWRKHPDLHGWMKKLYAEKGGKHLGDEPDHWADDFNTVPVVVDSVDLDRLEVDMECGQLPRTTGFFFGASRPEHVEMTREFITKARAAIAAGKTVYYYGNY